MTKFELIVVCKCCIHLVNNKNKMESMILCSKSAQGHRSLAIKPMDPSKQSFVLILEHIPDSNGSSDGVNCTARFQPASSFDVSKFRPLLSSPVYGCIGLVLVDKGK